MSLLLVFVSGLGPFWLDMSHRLTKEELDEEFDLFLKEVGDAAVDHHTLD